MVLRIVITIQVYMDHRLSYEGSGVCTVEGQAFNGTDLTWEATLSMGFCRVARSVYLRRIRMDTPGATYPGQNHTRYVHDAGFGETYGSESNCSILQADVDSTSDQSSRSSVDSI
jgi:hypothetical protein